MIKIFLKSPSVDIHYDEEESPSLETVGVQYEEEEDDEQPKLFNENNESNNRTQNQNKNQGKNQRENENEEDREEEKEEDDENVVFIRKTPIHLRGRLRRKTTKRFKYF